MPPQIAGHRDTLPVVQHHLPTPETPRPTGFDAKSTPKELPCHEVEPTKTRPPPSATRQ